MLLTVFFVWTTCTEYALQETSTILSTTPITTKNNPTVTMCFRGTTGNITFGDSFTARYRYWNGSSWNIDQTMVRKLAILDHSIRNCFMFKKLNVDIRGRRKIYLEIIFKDEMWKSSKSTSKPWVYITTEENAYGIVTQRWFDGEVFKFDLEENLEFFVKLPNVHQYEYLKHLCSNNSFYKCIMDKMADSNQCSKQGGLCEAVSLPSPLPTCKSETARTCTIGVFWKAYDSCTMEKACTSMEYRLQGLHGRDEKWKQLDTIINKNATFSFGYGFIPGESQDRQIQLQKSIHTEYLVWSEFTLVAYISGMLGLTIGISLLDVYNWMINKAEQVWKTWCSFKKR